MSWLAVRERTEVPCFLSRFTWKVGRVWFNATVLKTVEQKCSVGSNPTLSSSRCTNDTIATIHMLRHCITEWLSQGIVIRLAYIVLTWGYQEHTHNFSSCWVGVKSQPIGCTHSLTVKQIDDGSNPSVCG